jgi:hypothetical protein
VRLCEDVSHYSSEWIKMLKKILDRFGRSTKHAVICGMRKQTQIGNQIWFNRAKRRTYIDDFLSSANEKDKLAFLTDFDKIVSMLFSYATVSERLLVFIDNNVLQDIAKRESEPKRRQRFCSLVAALSFAQDYCLMDVFACISPVILFEGCGKKADISARDVDALVAKITMDIAQLGLVTHFSGFDTSSQLRGLFRHIQADEKQIGKALKEIVTTAWNREFSSASGGTRIPLSLADEECPDIRLRYFNPWVVKFLLVHMIEKRMYLENKNHAKARRLMVYGSQTTFSVLKKRTQDVEGLGDIELMTHCNLTTQTMNHSPQITMALTFDGRLFDALKERARVGQIGPSVEGGSTHVADFSRAFAWSIWHSQKKNQSENQKVQRFLEQKIEFEDEVLKPHFRSADEPAPESMEA